jgi:hypothetical protein
MNKINIQAIFLDFIAALQGLKNNNINYLSQDKAEELLNNVNLGNLSNQHKLKFKKYLIKYLIFASNIVFNNTDTIDNNNDVNYEEKEEGLKEQTIDLNDVDILSYIPKKQIDEEWSDLIESERLRNE